MVFVSPFNNIRGFVTTRPPLVLFTTCLIAFAATTFTFAYYVEYKSDLPNIDAHRDWVSFLSYLSQKKLCLNNAQSVGTSTFQHNDNETGDIITVSVSASFNTNILQNTSYVQGFIPTTDWQSECPSEQVKGVKVSFSVPSEISSEICVFITGPRHLLGPAAEEQKCSYHLTSRVPKYTVLNINSSTEFCTDGIVTTLKYKPSQHNTMLLTLHDRSIINLHLFHTSYFLLVMAITLICYAMIKGKAVKHQSLDKVPLDA